MDDEEIKEDAAARRPYRAWLEQHLRRLADLPPGGEAQVLTGAEVTRRQAAFGYTLEDLNIVLGPMASQGREPTGSMGVRHAAGGALGAAAAALQLLQAALRAGHQPAARRDPRRAGHVAEHLPRPRGRPVRGDPAPLPAALASSNPILTNEDLEKIRAMKEPSLRATTLPMRFAAADGPRRPRAGAGRALRRRLAGGRRGLHAADPLGPGRGRGPRADPRAPGRRGGAPPPDPQAAAHAVRPHRRERRAARGAPLRPAVRLRRGAP